MVAGLYLCGFPDTLIEFWLLSGFFLICTGVTTPRRNILPPAFSIFAELLAFFRLVTLLFDLADFKEVLEATFLSFFILLFLKLLELENLELIFNSMYSLPANLYLPLTMTKHPFITGAPVTASFANRLSLFERTRFF